MMVMMMMELRLLTEQIGSTGHVQLIGPAAAAAADDELAAADDDDVDDAVLAKPAM